MPVFSALYYFFPLSMQCFYSIFMPGCHIQSTGPLLCAPIFPVGYGHITHAPNSPEQIIPTHIPCTRRDKNACSVHIIRVIGSYLWASSGESGSPLSTFFLAPTEFIVSEFRKGVIMVCNYFMKTAESLGVGVSHLPRRSYFVVQLLPGKVEVPKQKGVYNPISLEIGGDFIALQVPTTFGPLPSILDSPDATWSRRLKKVLLEL